MGERNISERKKMDITHLQSECVTGYSKYANITISESSKLFTEYNLFEFIKNCYDVLHLDDVDYVIENDIAKRISNGIRYRSENVNATDIPNAETLAAFEEGDRMLSDPTAQRFSSVDDLMKYLNS